MKKQRTGVNTTVSIVHNKACGYIFAKQFIKFGKYDSQIYECKLIRGQWPSSIQTIIDDCSRGYSNGGGMVRIDGRKAHVVVNTG